jgi:hypothetical protein
MARGTEALLESIAVIAPISWTVRLFAKRIGFSPAANHVDDAATSECAGGVAGFPAARLAVEVLEQCGR